MSLTPTLTLPPPNPDPTQVHLMESPERWHALGMVMQDRDADVREAFALKLSKVTPNPKPETRTRTPNPEIRAPSPEPRAPSPPPNQELGRAFNGSKNLPNKAGTPAHFLLTRRLCLPPYYMAFFALAAGDADKVSPDPL